MQIEHRRFYRTTKRKSVYLVLLLCLILLSTIFCFWGWQLYQQEARLLSESIDQQSLANGSPNVAEYTSLFVAVNDSEPINNLMVKVAPTATDTLTPLPSPIKKSAIASLVEEPTATPSPTASPTFPPTQTAVSNPTNSWTLTAVADAHTTARRPTDNFGNLSRLTLQFAPEYNTYLRFDIPELPNNITQATLRLQVVAHASTGVDLFLVANNEWQELGITHQNAPSMDTFIASSRSLRANTWLTIDVTQFVNQPGLVSFGLTTENDEFVGFSSRESVTPPQLILTLGDAPFVPLPTATQTSLPTATPPPTATPTAVFTNTPLPPPTITPTNLPVSVPPTPTETPEPVVEVLTYTAVADAFTNINQPNNNFGLLSYMSLDSAPVKSGLIRFDASDFSGTVIGATLRVYAHDTTEDQVMVFDVENDSWGETAVTYSNAPTFGVQLGNLDGVTANQWLDIELETAVLHPGLISFGLTSNTRASIELSSRETSRPPQLILTVQDYVPIVPPVPEPPPITPPDDCEEKAINWIKNGTFDVGTANWSFFSDGKGTFSATMPDPTHCDKAAQITIEQAGQNVQLFQSGIVLQPDSTYILRFAAKSSSGNNMSLFLQKHEPNYKSYGLNNIEVDLTTEWQLFQIEFTTSGFNGVVNNGRLRFWLAPYDQPGDIYWIDQVELSVKE